MVSYLLDSLDNNLDLMDSLNPYCNGRWSRTAVFLYCSVHNCRVLILIVMEDGLVRLHYISQFLIIQSLNPYCNGRWSRTYIPNIGRGIKINVLILIVMEDGLVLANVSLYVTEEGS